MPGVGVSCSESNKSTQARKNINLRDWIDASEVGWSKVYGCRGDCTSLRCSEA